MPARAPSRKLIVEDGLHRVVEVSLKREPGIGTIIGAEFNVEGARLSRFYQQLDEPRTFPVVDEKTHLPTGFYVLGTEVEAQRYAQRAQHEGRTQHPFVLQQNEPTDYSDGLPTIGYGPAWDGQYYPAGRLFFTEAEANKLVQFITRFREHFVSGEATAQRTEGKRNRLGKRLLVGELRGRNNPRQPEVLYHSFGYDVLNAYVYPESGTDTIEFAQAKGSVVFTPHFTNASTLMTRYSNANGPEVLGYDESAMMLVVPLEGRTRYQPEGGTARWGSTPSKQRGLYANVNDVHQLLRDIHKAQQQGWQIEPGSSYLDTRKVPNFPFNVKLELTRGGDDVADTVEARAEYMGKGKDGMPRVQFTVLMHSLERAWRREWVHARANQQVVPRVYTATQADLMANVLRKEDGSATGSARRLNAADATKVLVALDARYERGLKGVEGVRDGREDIVLVIDTAKVEWEQPEHGWTAAETLTNVRVLAVGDRMFALDAINRSGVLTYFGSTDLAAMRKLSQQGTLQVEEQGAGDWDVFLTINPEDMQQLAVKLDELEEKGALRGLGSVLQRGLGAVQRRASGTIVHLPNVMERNTAGQLLPVFPFADACHSGGAQQTHQMLVQAAERVQDEILLLQKEAAASRGRVAHFLDEEGEKPDAILQSRKELLTALRDTNAQLLLEMTRGEPDLLASTPVCFSARKMVATHEGTHAALALAWPPESNTMLSFFRNKAIRDATQQFLLGLGRESKLFWENFGSELQPKGRTEEVIAGLMGMTVAVRMSVHNKGAEAQQRAADIAKETADAFATYLKPYQSFVDKQELQLSMWKAASEIVAKYRSDTAALEDFAMEMRRARRLWRCAQKETPDAH